MADASPKSFNPIHLDLDLHGSPLGQSSDYPSTYTPSLLHAFDRASARAKTGLSDDDIKAIRGEDLWTGYEFSWLNTHGKPVVAGIRLRIPCQSPALVESKSIKLYLNSFAQTKFENQSSVLHTLDQDLSLAFRAPVLIELLELDQLVVPVHQLSGLCLDDLDIHTHRYERDPHLLSVEESGVQVNESFYTHLFRSLCPVTAQPDWATVGITYSGTAINRENLLKYLVSYRTHQAFHETTIEQIYCDIWTACGPQKLSVSGHFQRRGGLDINPFRSSEDSNAPLCRLPRQ